MDGVNGALSLALRPPGGAEVSNSPVTGFKQGGNGSGRLLLKGLAPGTYKTKVSPASGSTVRATLELKLDRSYLLSGEVAAGPEASAAISRTLSSTKRGRRWALSTT